MLTLNQPPVKAVRYASRVLPKSSGDVRPAPRLIIAPKFHFFCTGAKKQILGDPQITTASDNRRRRCWHKSLHSRQLFRSSYWSTFTLFKLLFLLSRAAAIIAFVMCYDSIPNAYVFAESATRSFNTQAPLAEPKPQGANPFLPSANRNIRLPVTIEGFCVVTLREQQKWQLGSEANQLVFDGQLYWFAGQRQRAMFAATPQRYVPALAGNCIVTFAESGTRKRGDPQYGILHNQQLFFFLGETEQKKFQANPEQYSNLDLANEGRCLVTQIDDKQQLPGLPETAVTVGGLRYHFAGIHQQQKFLANMEHYGVTKPNAPQPKQTPSKLVRSTPEKQNPDIKKKMPPTTISVAGVANKAMGGYSPVSIHEQGTWVLGDLRYHFEFEGLTYFMVSEAEKNLFAENPETYVPVRSGQCVVTEVNDRRQVPGSIYHAAQYENRLFLFAGPEQKIAFGKNPENYVSNHVTKSDLPKLAK